MPGSPGSARPGHLPDDLVQGWAVKGRSLSSEAPERVRVLVRSRLLTDEELEAYSRL